MADRAHVLRCAKHLQASMKSGNDPRWKLKLFRWCEHVHREYDVGKWKQRGNFLVRRTQFLSSLHMKMRVRYDVAKKSYSGPAYVNSIIQVHNEAQLKKLRLIEEINGLAMILYVLDEGRLLLDPAVSQPCP